MSYDFGHGWTVYVVTVDDVKVGTFSTYDKAMDFIQDCRALKPYAQYGIKVVLVDTGIVYRVDKEGKNECFGRVG